MRLAGVKNIDEANKYLEGYIVKFNEQFGVEAKIAEPAYREFDSAINLDEIFTVNIPRRVQAGELVTYNGNKYVLEAEESLVGHEADIKKYRDGRMEIHVRGEKVEYRYFSEMKRAA